MSERADLGFVDTGLGRVSQGERRMLRVGSWTTLPDANEREADGTFRWVGYFARTDSGTFVCERDGTGALWKLVASGAQGPQGPQGPEGPPGSGGSIQVESGDSGVFTAATVDFDAGDFVVTQSPSGEANVSLASAPAFSSFANAQHNHQDATGGGVLSSAAISDFAETVDDRVDALIVDGAGIQTTYNDGAGTLTIASTITQYSDELAQDAVGAMLADTSSINLTYSDVTPELKADAIFGTSAGTVAEGNHTHAQLHDAATVADSASLDLTLTGQQISGAVVADSTQQRVGVRKNSTGTTHVRQRINLIEGSNVTLTVADDGADNEIDVTIAASGGGGALAIEEGNVAVVATASALNFDASDFNVTDAGSGQADVELAYGTSAGTPAEGNHTHAQLHDAVTVADSSSIDLTLTGQQISAAAIFGSSAGTVAEGNHAHGGVYQPLDSDLTALATAFTAASASGPATLALAEDTDNGAHSVSIAAPASVASNKTATLQDVTGTLYVSGGTDIPVADGGTGASDAATARTNLGVAIGSDVQAYDADLGAIAGLAPSNDDVIQRKAGAWANRTPAQLKTDLALVKGDVGLGNVDNTSDANKPISTATQTALDGKQPLDADLTTLASAFTTASASGAASLALAEDTDNGSNTVSIAAPASVASNKTATLQDVTGTLYVSGGTDVAVADGGTGASDASGARTNLGLVIGTDVQAYDAELAALAGLTSAADRLPYFTGSGTAALATFTAAGRAILDDADAAAQRTTLGLAIGTDVQAYDADLADIAAIADTQGDIIIRGASGWERLAAGTSGHFLKTQGAAANPVWAAAASGSGGALTYLNVMSPSSVTNVTLDSLFSSSYDNYLLVFQLAHSANAALQVRLRTGAADNSTSNYHVAATKATTSAHAVEGHAAAAQWSIAPALGQITTELTGYMLLHQPHDAIKTLGELMVARWPNAGGTFNCSYGGIFHNVASAFDGIKFMASTGNITGTIRIYGVSDS